MKYWNYGWNAAYFITICTHNRQQFFGSIHQGEMKLSPIGKIAHTNWMKIPEQFPPIQLGEFIIMPDHMHGIIIINNPINTRDTDAMNRASTKIYRVSPGGITGKHNPMLSTNNLSKIIRWYKGRTTYESRKIQNTFKWHSGYYEHVIRNDKAFHNISNYIKNNPKNWNKK